MNPNRAKMVQSSSGGPNVVSRKILHRRSAQRAHLKDCSSCCVRFEGNPGSLSAAKLCISMAGFW